MSKVAITVSAKDFIEVLENIKLDNTFRDNSDFTIELDILDEKENFEYICKSSKIKNWEFLENTITDKKDDIKKEKVENLKHDEFYEIFRELTGLEDFKSDPYTLLLKILKVICRVKKKSPALRFTKLVFEPYISSNNLIIEVNNSDDNIYIKLLKYYYKDVSNEEMLDHMLRELKSKWKELEKCENISNIISLITI